MQKSPWAAAPAGRDSDSGGSAEARHQSQMQSYPIHYPQGGNLDASGGEGYAAIRYPPTTQRGTSRFGNFLERSTSEPPPSSASDSAGAFSSAETYGYNPGSKNSALQYGQEDDNNDALVGNVSTSGCIDTVREKQLYWTLILTTIFPFLLLLQDLLEHMSSMYVDYDRSVAGTKDQYGNSRVLQGQNDFSGFLGGGFATAAGSDPVPRPVSASEHGSGSVASNETGGDHMLGASSRYSAGTSEVGLIRSKSAAPSLHHEGRLVPPPGMNLNSSHSDSYASNVVQIGRQRSASTEVIGNGPHPTLRPSAKTLMDLIQEDSKQEDSPDQAAAMNNQGFRRGIMSSPGIEHDHYAAQDPYHRQQKFDQEQEGFRYQRDGLSPLAGSDRVSSQYDYQTSVPSQFSYVGPSPTSPVDQYRRQGDTQDLLPHQNRGGPIYIQQQSRGNSRGPMVDASQQLYYTSAPTGQQQRVEVQGSGIQAQMLQGSGGHHSVYVGTAATPQPTYGYTTIQYTPSPPPPQQQSQHQTSQIIQTATGEQYVSIVPVHRDSGGSQMTYWQPDIVTQAQGPGGQITFMNVAGPGGGPIAVSRGGTISGRGGHDLHGRNQHHHHSQHPQNATVGRMRERNGRGRRGGAGNSRRADSKNAGSSSTSPLLDEFRVMKNRDWTMHQIIGHVVEFCQDQNGSRFIQQRLEMGDIGEQQIVVKEVLPAIRVLRNDVFGNYVVQKLFDFGSTEVKNEIRDTLEGEMLQLSLQMYGCRVVQKALESLSDEDFPRLMIEFHHNVLSCIHDQNGNHVIQKCIEVVSKRVKKANGSGDSSKADFLNQQIGFIIRDVLVNTATLSCHPYGCRVLQRILEHCDEQRKKEVLDEIRKCHRKLLDDQYGNYVIQHVLQFGRPEDRDSILEIVVESGLLTLSRQKFASNVVEKLLKYGNSQQRRAVVREMLKVREMFVFNMRCV